MILLLMSFKRPTIKTSCIPGSMGEMRQKQEERESRSGSAFADQTIFSQLSLNKTDPLASIPLRYIYSFKQSAFLQFNHNCTYDEKLNHKNTSVWRRGGPPHRDVFVVKFFVTRAVVVRFQKCIHYA